MHSAGQVGLGSRPNFISAMLPYGVGIVFDSICPSKICLYLPKYFST